MKQEYALKEYVSENNYGKIINGSSSEILTNCNLTGDEAEAKIVALFGSIDLFKSCVQDMLDNHTRYFYHTEGGTDSCKEINGLAWKNADTYELDFLYEYWTSGIPYTKKVVLQVADSNNTRIAIIEDISTDKSLEQKFAPSEKRLESNSDLNDYKTQGSWWESSTATLNTIANKPVGGVGEAVLQVFSCGNNYKLQVFYNITQNLVFIRAYQADHWTSWKDCSGNVTQGGDGIWSIRTNGNAQFQRVASVNGFFKESDKRLKSNIQPLNHTIEQICAIPTDKFVMNGHIQIGTIAQDLENIVPEIVSEDYKLASEVSNKEEFEIIERKDKERVEEYIKVKKVEYEMLGVLAIEGIKLLKQEIDKLNNRIKELENGRDSDVEHD
nr:MAG TPA_asm: endosialidase chaperone [Caudoviricetes sp.]